MNHYMVVTANNNQVPTLYLLKCLACMLDTDQNLVLAKRLESLLAWLALARTPEQQKWGWSYLGDLLSHIY